MSDTILSYLACVTQIKVGQNALKSIDKQEKNLTEKFKKGQLLLEDPVNTDELCPETRWAISPDGNPSCVLGAAQNVLGPLLYSGRSAQALPLTLCTHPPEAFLHQ